MDISYLIFFSIFIIIMGLIILISYNRLRKNYERILDAISNDVIFETEELKCINWKRGFYSKNYTFNYCRLHLTDELILIQGYHKLLSKKFYSTPVLLAKRNNIITTQFKKINIESYELSVDGILLDLKFVQNDIIKLNVDFQVIGLEDKQLKRLDDILKGNWKTEKI